jgi:putative phosphoribosyl transferase
MFRDRTDAGRQLAEHIAMLHLSDAVVLALPSGGVPIAFEIAHALRAPLDVLVVRKLDSPWQPGISFGAIAEGGLGYVDPRIVLQAGVSRPEIEAVAESELQEVRRRVELWRGAWPPYPVENKVAVVVDDGVLTGSKVRAAIVALRLRHAGSILLVVPMTTLEDLRGDVICMEFSRRQFLANGDDRGMRERDPQGPASSCASRCRPRRRYRRGSSASGCAECSIVEGNTM